MTCYVSKYCIFSNEATARCPSHAWPDTPTFAPGHVCCKFAALVLPNHAKLRRPICGSCVLHFWCPHNIAVTAELSCGRKMLCVIPSVAEVQSRADRVQKLSAWALLCRWRRGG